MGGVRLDAKHQNQYDYPDPHTAPPLLLRRHKRTRMRVFVCLGQERKDAKMIAHGKAEAIPEAKFGRDHWSTLLYAESCAVDHSGVLDSRRMRKYNERGKYPTRLAGGEVSSEYHDDYACLQDLEREGYLGFWPAQASVVLTDKGWQKAGELRRARAEAAQQQA